jgi:hypothetical protein
MTTIELLIEAEKALNQIPNKKLKTQALRDTYELATKISVRIAELKCSLQDQRMPQCQTHCPGVD